MLDMVWKLDGLCRKIEAVWIFTGALYFCSDIFLFSELWHCWLCVRKSIQPVKNWVMRCCCGYLSGARCTLLACGPADATTIPKPPSYPASFKCRLVSPFRYRLIQVRVVHRFIFFHPIQRISWLTQPNPLQVEKIGPNTVQLTDCL